MKTYRMFTIGARSSGKTCFLGAFYKKLSVSTHDIGFSLRPLETTKIPWRRKESGSRINRLISIYNEIEGPSDWPVGTRDLDEWEFNCVLNAKDGNKYDILRLQYYDYRGSLLTQDPGDDKNLKDEIEMAEKRIASSDAILFFVDGHKLLLSMQNNDSGLDTTLDEDLNYLLPRLQGVGSKPVQFIITKWDLFNYKKGNNKLVLEEIKNKLFENRQFKALVEFQGAANGRTRIIPVSSVGSGFATIGKNQVMNKMPGVKAEPYQVEMPLACMLIDGFEAAYKKINPWQKKTLNNSMMAGGKISQLSLLIAAATILSLPIEPQYKIAYVPAIASIFKWGGDEVEKIVKEIREKKAYEIQNKNEATLKVIERCKSLTEELTRAHPSSILT